MAVIGVDSGGVIAKISGLIKFKFLKFLPEGFRLKNGCGCASYDNQKNKAEKANTKFYCSDRMYFNDAYNQCN